MSGENHPDDDADFLDEDFVVEDLAGQNDQLEDLFDETAPAAGAAAAQQDAQGDPDEDDVLFTDHTQKIENENPFEARKPFDEGSGTEWTGENLDLESVGVPSAAAQGGDDFDDELGLDEARESFTAELDSMLQSNEDEFALDSESELELIGGGSTDVVDEFEQSGPFVLDDGEGLWSDEQAEEAPADEAAPAYAEASGYEEQELQEVAAIGDDVGMRPMELREASGNVDEEQLAEGWEPLPGRSMDELAEVDEVQRTPEELAEEAASITAPRFGPAQGEEQDLEDVDGHDIYDEEEEEPEVIGAQAPARGRLLGMLSTLAAAAVVLGGGATVIAKPEWFGLRIEPQRVERVDLPRPKIEFSVPEPARPEPVPEQPSGNTGGQTGEQPGEQPVEPVTTTPGETPVEGPVGGEAPGGQTPVEGPAPGGTLPGETPPETPSQPSVPSVGATVPPSATVGSDSPPVVDVPSVTESWPVAAAPQQPAVGGATQPGALVPFGDGLMVGNLDDRTRPVQALDGVMPGSRAFAQLHNGNYFIGSVKQVAEQSITLRVEDGEVTLATADIAQLTQLGSADYDQLQKATRGFVRLTNNNRLVGGILSRIADDHIVLEFRSNRVMLPRSAIGEIVSGEAEQAVRLDTTNEEDSWVRDLAERQLGTGLGSEQPAPEAPKQRPEPAPRSAPPK